MNDLLKLSHHYPGAYHQPGDLWTPEEISEAGFVFVQFPTFIHKHDDPTHPIMKSYCDGDSNLKPMVVKSHMYTPSYVKTYDLDAGRNRGIESVNDYFSKKEIFKPMILAWMKEKKFHYVYRVQLGDSPCIWNGKFGTSDMFHYMFPVFVRAARLHKLTAFI
jgi:hypothetical protein